MNKENKLTPEEITSVISEQPDLYEPTVQPLSERQNDGYYPIQVDSSEKEAITPSLAKLATPKSDRTWLERLKAGAKLAITNIMNEQLTHNVALGSKKITLGKNEEEVEYGRRMAAEAKRHIDEIMDDTEQLTPEEAESWATAIGSGSMSMVDFAANLALLRGLGAGSIGAQIGAGFLAGVSGYEEGALSDIEKYIAETGDTELKDYKGDKVGYVANVASGTIQGTIESLTQGLGKFIFTNPLSKKVLGNWGEETGRKIVSTAVGRALAAGADESVSNAFEEWTQQLTGNIAEIVKGNKEFTVDNILQGAGQAAGVGALLGWMATPVMQEYGRRKTRDWVMDKLRKSADEKGIQVSDAEIKQAANDLVGVIESKGVQQVADNYEKINQITGSESDLAQKLAQVFQDLVKQGYVNFRNMTDDELRQAGLDWANWMQAQAILDSLDREIPLTDSPLFNAVAELDRIYLEGRNAGEGDLLPLDINNAQVDYLATQIDDFINQNKETREAAEQARIAALRESDLKSRQAMIAELERNAQEELAKERAAQNEEAIRSLTATIVRLQAEMRATQEEVSKLLADRTTQGRISIKQARDILAPKNKELPNAKPKYPTKVGEKITFDKEGRTFEVERLNRGYKVTALVNGKPVANIQVNDNGTVQSVETVEKERRNGHGTALIKEAESIVGPMMVTIPEGDSGLEQFWWKNGYSQEIEPRTFVRNDVVLGKVENKADEPMYQEGTERLDDIYPEYEGDTILVDGVERTVYNAEGKRIAKSAESLTNFWRWFGNSKIVDGFGRPLVVYHGSYEKAIAAFDKSTFGNSTGNLGMFGEGFYFTDEMFIAEDYAGIQEGNEEDSGKVYSVYLKIENPLVIDSTVEYGEGNEDSDAALDALKKKKLLGKDEGWTDFYAKIWEDDKPAIFLSQYAKDNGFDGTIGYYSSPYFMDHGSTRVEYVAFEPTQIKDIDNLGYWGEEDDRLMYQTGFASMKGELIGDSLDWEKFQGTGEGHARWLPGNYLLANRDLDKQYYYDNFVRWGPTLKYDGEVVDSADFFNKLKIFDGQTRERLARANSIFDTKERVVKDLERTIKMDQDAYDKHIERVVSMFTKWDKTKTREIISDIEKIIRGKGVAVGPLADFDKTLQPDEYKIQQKYRDKDGTLSSDFKAVFAILQEEFGGNHWFDGDFFTRDIINLMQKKKSLEIVKKMDWDKFSGKTGMSFQGKDVSMVISQIISSVVGDNLVYEANESESLLYRTIRDALVHNKNIKSEIKKLEEPYKKIVDVIPTLKKEIKAKFKEILGDKTLQTRDLLKQADAKAVEKAVLEWVEGINSADYSSFTEFLEKHHWGTYDNKNYEDLLADAVIWSRFDKSLYPEGITKEGDNDFIDLIYAVRSAHTSLEIVKAVAEKFTNNKDFVYKANASMWKSDNVPENKYLLDMSKSLKKQSVYVQKAIMKLFNETGAGIEPVSWENIRLINDRFPRIYDANKILPDPKSEVFKNDKMKTINLYDNIVNRFAKRWSQKGLDYALDDLKRYVDTVDQQRDEFKANTKRTGYPDNVIQANKTAYEEEYDISKVLHFIYDNALKIPTDADVNDYVYVEPEVLDRTTGMSYAESLARSLRDEEFSKLYDSLNVKPLKDGKKDTWSAVSKLLLRYGIKGTRYWGGRDRRGFSIFEPVKMDERIFQESLDNVDKDTLVAIHSMSLEGAMKALDLGGLAMPSLAVTKAEDGVRGLYGDVILVGDIKLSEPSRLTDVYDRDAWTPIVNSIIYEFDNDMYKKIQDLLKEKGENENSASSYTHNIAASMTDGADPRNNTMAVELFAIYKGIDQDTAREQIKYNWDKPYTPLHQEYNEWYKDFLLKNAKAYIHMGWTPSGAIRKKPLNLENLVSEMKTQARYARMGGDYFTPSDVLKFNLVRFKNLKEVRNAQGRLVPTNEAVETTREMGSEFFALASELKPDNVEGYDATDQRLAYAIIYGGKGTLQERLANNGLKSDPESVKKVEDFIKKVKAMPVKYFEVKPRRAVRFDEFPGAILPTSQEYDVLEERLRDAGMLYVYRADTPEQKKAALQDLYKKDPAVLWQNKKTSKSMTGLGKEHRGAYDPLTKAIIFNKVSDVTSLFHESAHYWFDRNLRYYKTGMASPDWKKRWEEVMDELGLQPNSKGQYTRQAVRAASEKFARSMEAYLKGGHYENAAIQWAHQDYANMVGRVYRSLWSQYWGLEDLSPAVKKWFDMFGYDVENPASAYKEEGQTIESDEEMVGAIVAEDQTQPEADPVVNAVAQAEGGQVVENIATGEVAVVPEDKFETEEISKSRLPKSAEKATGVKTEDIEYNRRSMSESMKAAQDLVEKDPVRAWEAIRSGEEMVDGLYAGDIYRALIAKYKAENNPTMIKTVVQTFANAARRAGRSVKAFDLETPTSTFEGAVRSIDKLFEKGSNKKKVDNLVKELKEFLHDPEALNKGWEKFKDAVECK